MKFSYNVEAKTFSSSSLVDSKRILRHLTYHKTIIIQFFAKKLWGGGEGEKVCLKTARFTSAPAKPFLPAEKQFAGDFEIFIANFLAPGLVMAF
jgi:hypothetical protein